jgi:predicted NACHT family NTPase
MTASLPSLADSLIQALRQPGQERNLAQTLAQSENSRLKELIQNPLQLWMSCQILQPEGGSSEVIC